MTKGKDNPSTADEPPAQKPISEKPGRVYGSLTAHYAPGEKRPVASYAVLASVYGALTAGAVLAMRARDDRLPDHVPVVDLLLLGVATHKVSRLLSKDKVTSFIRAPFTKFQEASGQGEVEEAAYGDGLRYSVGELLICPYCLGQWVATAFTLGFISAPRLTRAVSSVFVLTTISDSLQIAYRLAENQL